MKVQVFAKLKDYFDKEFQLNANIQNAEALKEHLIRSNPAAAGILERCRFAVNDEFVDTHFQITENDTIFIIPPSSGG
ncbi:MAG: MoaD/ThiS family protein [Chitinophagaceae bacterium]